MRAGCFYITYFILSLLSGLFRFASSFVFFFLHLILKGIVLKAPIRLLNEYVEVNNLFYWQQFSAI